jgi:hypothetical protein
MAQDAEEKSIVITNVFKTAKHLSGDRYNVTALQNSLTIGPVLPPGKLPLPSMDYEDLLCIMAMVRVFATVWLARCAYIETMWMDYMYYLIWILCYPCSNKAKVLLFVTSRGASVNKRGFARYYLCVP